MLPEKEILTPFRDEEVEIDMEVPHIEVDIEMATEEVVEDTVLLEGILVLDDDPQEEIALLPEEEMKVHEEIAALRQRNHVIVAVLDVEVRVLLGREQELREAPHLLLQEEEKEVVLVLQEKVNEAKKLIVRVLKKIKFSLIFLAIFE